MTDSSTKCRSCNFFMFPVLSSLHRIGGTLLLLLLTVFPALAQNPVQVNLNVTSTSSARLSDYYLSATPKLIVTLLNKDFTKAGLEVRLRVSIRNIGNNNMISTNERVNLPSIFLDGGVPIRLSGTDLEPYLNPANLVFTGFTAADYQRAGKLPEGTYEFCVQAVETFTNRVVSNNGCTIQAVTLNQPPLLMKPDANAVVPLTEPTNIQFSWSPRSTSVSKPEYTLQLVELWDKAVNPQSAFESLPVFFETSTPATVFNYGPAQPLLIPGKTYAFRVKAARALDQFGDEQPYSNGGYSEVRSFTYGSSCAAPEGIFSEARGTGALITWQGQFPSMVLEYRMAGSNSSWKTGTPGAANAQLSGLTPNTSYEYRLGNRCNSTDIAFAKTQLFKTINDTGGLQGRVLWSFTEQEEATDLPKPILSTSISTDSLYRLPISQPGKRRYGLPGAILTARFMGGRQIQRKMQVPVLTPAAVWVPGKGYIYLQDSLVPHKTLTRDSNYIEYADTIKTIAKTDAFGHFDFVWKKNISGHNAYTNEPPEGSAIQLQIDQNESGYNRRTVTVQPDKSGKYLYAEYFMPQATMEIEPVVYRPHSKSKEQPNVRIEVAVKSYWNNMMLPLLSGPGMDRKIKISGDDIILATSTGGSLIKQLPNASVNVRFIFPNGKTVTRSVNGYGPGEGTPVIRLVVEEPVINIVEGVVSLNDALKSNVIVEVRPLDLNDKSFPSMTTTTDSEGRYRFEIPYLKNPTMKLHFSLSGGNLSGRVDTATMVPLRMTKNFELSNNLRTIIGRVVDQDGAPIGNALVRALTVFGQGEPRNVVRSGKEGFYALLIDGKQNCDVEIIVDGYDRLSKTVSAYVSKGGGEQYTGEIWKKKIEASKVWADFVQKYSVFITKKSVNDFRTTEKADYDKAIAQYDIDNRSHEAKMAAWNVAHEARRTKYHDAMSQYSPAMYRYLTAERDRMDFGRPHNVPHPGPQPTFSPDWSTYPCCAPNKPSLPTRTDEEITALLTERYKNPPPVMEAFALGSDAPDAILNHYTGADSRMRQVIDQGNAVVKLKKGKVSIRLASRTAGTRAMVSIAGMAFQQRSLGMSSDSSLLPGTYTYDVVPVAGDLPFANVSGTFTIRSGETTVLTVKVLPLTTISGTVRTKDAAAAPIKDADISVIGYTMTTKTDAAGRYVISVPMGEEVQFRVAAPKYNSTDSSFTFNKAWTVDFRLDKRDESIPNITSISGFSVTIDKILRDRTTDVFTISGKLTLEANDIFAPAAGSEKLTFTNLPVKATTSGAAVPLADIAFEEAVLPARAYGFASVEVTGSPSLALKPLKDAQGNYTYEKGTIGGEKIVLRLNDESNVSLLPIRLPDATLRSDDSSVTKLDAARGKPFAFAFTAPGAKINALSKSKAYKVVFSEPDLAARYSSFKRDTTKRDPTYVTADLGFITQFFIEREAAVLNESGLNLNGYVQFPKLTGVRVADSGKVVIKKFVIGKDFKLAELTFNVSDASPLKLNLQKVSARVRSLSIYGLGTENPGFGVGGIVILKKSAPASAAPPKLGGSANAAGGVKPIEAEGPGDTLFIKNLSVVNKEEGLSLDGRLAFGAQGVSVKGLTFNTPGDYEVGMSYNFKEKSFVFEASGILTYNPKTAPKEAGVAQAKQASDTAATNSIFPIEIQSFRLNTKDWSLFLAAKANVKLNMKVVTIAVDRLVVSIGSGLTMEAMNSYLVGGTEPAGSIGTSAPDELMDESAASWAIGVKGGVEFALKGIGANIGGSFLIGNVDNKFQFRMNEIMMGMEQPSFKLAATVKLAFGADSTGFEGSAELTALSKGMAATFKFYKINEAPGRRSGISIGASVKINATFVTGPIQWFGIGGGFDFNTSTNKYSVQFMGDLGAPGTPKTSAYLQDGYVSVLFDVDRCGVLPVIEGGGSLSVTEKVWGSMMVRADFCRKLLLVVVKGEVPFAEAIKVNVDGVIFAAAANETDPACLFIGCNASLSALGDMLKGNAFLGLGINYNNSHPYAPAEARSLYNMIPLAAKDNNGASFHGVYINCSLNAQAKGGVDASIAGFSVFKLSYDFVTGGAAMVYVRFRDKNFRITANVEHKVNLEASILSFTLGGGVQARLAVDGGYDGKWYFKGDARAQGELYNKKSLACNKIEAELKPSCFDLPYPCGWDWWDITWCKKNICMPVPSFSFKACVGLGLKIDYRQDRSTILDAYIP